MTSKKVIYDLLNIILFLLARHSPRVLLRILHSLAPAEEILVIIFVHAAFLFLSLPPTSCARRIEGEFSFAL